MIRQPLEAIVDPRASLVFISASIQSCKTMCAEIALSYIVANMPGPTLWLDQTDADAKDQAEGRLHKLFDEIAPVRSLYPADRHKKRNQTIHFANGMTLWALGANNKTNLQRRSIRWLFGDECWRWPQGHMAEAEARVTAFGWLGKRIFFSQAGEADDDSDQKFRTTDMREWMFACPHCQERQPFAWTQVEWDKDAKTPEGWDFMRVRKSTYMRCKACDGRMEDTDNMRRTLNASAVFVPQNASAPPDAVGFHWNALATMSWGALAEIYLRAKLNARAGDVSALKQFWQKRLAIPWREYVEDYKLEIVTASYRKGEPWECAAGINRQGKVVPPGSDGIRYRLYVLTVDVQQDHYYVVVRAWSETGSSRLIWHEKVFQLSDIEAIQTKFLVHPMLVFIDARHDTYNVYTACSKRGWTALMGHDKLTFAHRTASGKSIERFYSPVRAVALGTAKANMHYFSNLNIKDTLTKLRRNQDPEAGPTWEVYDEADEDYRKQLESERRVKDGDKWRWKLIGHRDNHYWDCEVMQACAATMLKLIGREAVEPEEASSPVPAPGADEA